MNTIHRTDVLGGLPRGMRRRVTRLFVRFSSVHSIYIVEDAAPRTIPPGVLYLIAGARSNRPVICGNWADYAPRVTS